LIAMTEEEDEEGGVGACGDDVQCEWVQYGMHGEKTETTKQCTCTWKFNSGSTYRREGASVLTTATGACLP
jgi:hypothetical protein